MSKRELSPLTMAADQQIYSYLNPAYTESADAQAYKAALGEVPRYQSNIVGGEQAVIREMAIQMFENEVWNEKRGASKEEFAAAPRTFPKTVQEILTPPEAQMAFGRGEDLEQCIDSIIISPDLTDQILKNLGLAQFLPEKGKRHSEAEKIKHKAEAIPEVREMLRFLEPVKLPHQRGQEMKYFRLMRATKGKNEGAIIGTQNVEGQKTLFKTDLYGAMRRILHIEAGYSSEIEKLKLIQLTLENVRNGLGEWADIKNTGQLEELRGRLAEVVDSLRFVRDEHKVKLGQKVAEALTFQDNKGRPNPGRSNAKLVSAEAEIGKRMASIERIWGYLGGDKAKIHQLIQDQEAPMKDFLEVTETLHARFGILKAKPLEGAEKEKVRANLFGLRAAAQKQKFEPHLSFGRKWIEQIDKVIVALDIGDSHETAKKEFVKVYLLAKIFRTYTQLQKVNERLSLRPQEVDPRQLLDRIQAINDDLRKKTVAGEVSTPEYDKAYGEIYHLLNSIKKRLRGLINPAAAAGHEQERARTEGQVPPKEATKKATLDDVLAKLRGIPLLGGVIGGIEDRLRRFLGAKLGLAGKFSAAESVPQPASDLQAAEVVPPNPEAVARIYREIREKLKATSFVEVVGKL